MRQCRINPPTTVLRYVIKTSNDARKKKKQYAFPFSYVNVASLLFLTPVAISTLSFSLSLSLAYPIGASFPSVSFARVQLAVRGVCTGSLTCCMLFCPGPSAILVFWTVLYRARLFFLPLLSDTRETRNPYCFEQQNTVISVDRRGSRPFSNPATDGTSSAFSFNLILRPTETFKDFIRYRTERQRSFNVSAHGRRSGGRRRRIIHSELKRISLLEAKTISVTARSKG